MEAMNTVQAMVAFGTIGVGSKVTFAYPTRVGVRIQRGTILPCYPDRPESPAIGEARTSQLSTGTGERFEPFVRVLVNWKGQNVSRCFNVVKIVNGSFQKG